MWTQKLSGKEGKYNKLFHVAAILKLAKFEYELMRADVKMRFFVSIIQSQV